MKFKKLKTKIIIFLEKHFKFLGETNTQHVICNHRFTYK